MTDTDDTDELLLIPPDFFVVHSDSERCSFSEPYYNIVESLIQRVDNLQTRIKSIESSESSLLSSFDMQNNSARRRFRKYNSVDEMHNPNSTQSTPQKSHTKFKLNSLPCTPSIDKLTSSQYDSLGLLRGGVKSETSSPNKGDNETLGEIDTFLSKVRTIQRINAVRNLEKDFDHSESPEKKNSNEVIDVLDEIKRQQDKIEATLAEPTAVKKSTWQSGDDKYSVPDYKMGARDILYDRGDQNHQDDSMTSPDRYPGSDSSSGSTQMTAFRKTSKSNLLSSPLHSHALSILNLHKQVLEDSDKKANVKKKAKQKGLNIVNDNLGLMSLADIWSTNSQLLNSNQSQLTQKLQEEKLRRQHCEGLIKDLQNKNLELQQKLTVAVSVDESKNVALQQFQGTLEKVMNRLDKLYKEKQTWEGEVERLKKKHVAEMEDTLKKVSYYEKEASRALHVAHGNHEKTTYLEKQCSDLQRDLKNSEKKLAQLQDDYTKELDKNKQLSGILSQKEIELNENKNTLNMAKKEVYQSQAAMDTFQKEFNAMKVEYEKMQGDLQDSKDIITNLTEQKALLLKEVENYRKKESESHGQIEQLKKQLESSKVELRNFYQGQVELLVQNKLKEFQTQLDQVETSYKEEIKKRELSIAKTAATHIQQISEKYTLEINLLEKKHQEEIKLHQIQAMQYKQQADNLQNELDKVQEKRIQIARQLQKIMEAQWAEALKIITSAKSPTTDEKVVNTLDQLKSLKNRSYHNVEEVLSQNEENNSDKIGNTNEDCLSSTSNEKLAETPVSSKTNLDKQNKQFNETEVQKYINLLLNMNRETEDKTARGAADQCGKGFWFNEPQSTNDAKTAPPKDRKHRKPPWK